MTPNKEYQKAYRNNPQNKEKARAYRKAYRNNPQNKEKARASNKQWSKNYRFQKRNFLRDYKKDKCCAFCGWSIHPEILQFHHTKDKIYDISHMPLSKQPSKRVYDEIKKCVLLCPNCHFWHHYVDKCTTRRI
jgi:hypothetical protein